MGFHICITNEEAVQISERNGVYGNVGNDDESLRVKWGKIRDLYIVKPGDLVVLYVKNPVSHFKGVYEVTSIPYICSDDLFDDVNELYSYRFNFQIKLNFFNPVPAFEFYALVEEGKINSLISLSRDINSSYRGIRQLFENEFSEIINVFYKYNPKVDPTEFNQIEHPDLEINEAEAVDFDIENLQAIREPIAVLFNRIPSINGSAILENVLHAYIVYNVLHDSNGVSESLRLTNYSEMILEAPVFKAMQFRSDILVTYKRENKTYYYSFFELKKDSRIGLNEISQLMGYLKSFSASKSLPLNSYEGVYISTRFSDELLDYLEKRKTVENENIISLFTYSINDIGEVQINEAI